MSEPIGPQDFKDWRDFIHGICGVYLDESKGYLIETRLGALLKEAGSLSWKDFLIKVKAQKHSVLGRQVVDAITTNETSFFRDTTPFELLQHKLFPELIDRRTIKGQRPIPIRILSAACSTGQEAYSTIFVLKELLGSFTGYDIHVLGLDISDQAVARASYGHFSDLEISRGLPGVKIERYFDRVGSNWKVKDELRYLASFRRANLLEPLLGTQQFDIVFCRNVAIYFNEADRVRLFRNLGTMMAPDGALIIGSTESLAGLCPEFEPRRYLRTVYYERNPGKV